MSQTFFDTPILILIYNRADTLVRISSILKSIAPKNLYISGDGPKDGNIADGKKCSDARNVFKDISYAKNVHYNYYSENLGCKEAVIGGISWFFQNEEQGIILESDTLPDLSFFQYCQNMLFQYKGDDKIKLISGTNYLYNKSPIKTGAFLSPFGPIWGWATWKRFWIEYVEDLNSTKVLPKDRYLQAYKNNFLFSTWIYNMVSQCYKGELDAWSPILVNTMIRTKGLAILPYQNLVSNIGQIGTHSHIGLKRRTLKVIDKLTLTKNLSALDQETHTYLSGVNSELVVDDDAFISIQESISNIVYGGKTSQLIVKLLFKTRSL